MSNVTNKTTQSAGGKRASRPEFPSSLGKVHIKQRNGDSKASVPVVKRPDTPRDNPNAEPAEKPKVKAKQKSSKSRPAKPGSQSKAVESQPTKKKLRVIHHPPNPAIQKALREELKKKKKDLQQNARDAELAEVVGYDVREERKKRELDDLVKALQTKQKPQEVEAPAEETEAEKQQREHQEKLDKLREALYRDDRGAVQKAYEQVKDTRMSDVRRHMAEIRGLNIRVWHIAVPVVMLALMLAVNFGGFGFGPQRVQAAPNEYGARCAICKYPHKIDRESFEMLELYRELPEQFAKDYPGKSVPEPECPRCHVAFSKLALVTCSDCEHQFLIAQSKGRDMSKDQEAINSMCVKCDSR